MSQTCTHCTRVNPRDALYCYYDGSALNGAHGATSAQAIGSQPFPTPFVFPSGHSCRNFDQLAMGCQDQWAAALDLLHQGFMERFLGGMGRADLAAAARAAAAFPDRERGLDQLLAKLPSQALKAPQLRVEPQELNLGTLQRGKPVRFELHLENQGGRLLYGSAVADCNWLRLGEGAGSTQKLFQCGSETVIAVQVVPEQLRAGPKGMEGRIIVESNGGRATLTVRAQMPAVAFGPGVLAGATTPRQIAEKAKAAPKEAAAFFEHGTVQKWYQANGWTYPVQGPSASGLGAVQQFFEALGLAKAPRVEVSESAVQLRGKPGDKVRHQLVVRSSEKRPVFAHACSDQPWLVVGLTQLNGATANIPLEVGPVPNRPGEVLQGKVTITANGNQRFVVPVTLTVGAASGARAAAVMPMALLMPEAMTPTVAVVHGDTDVVGRKSRIAPRPRQPVAAVVHATPPRPPRARQRPDGDDEGGGNGALKVLLICCALLLVLGLAGGLFALIAGFGGKPDSDVPVNVAVEDEKTVRFKSPPKKEIIKSFQVKEEDDKTMRLFLPEQFEPKIVEEPDEGPPPGKVKTEHFFKEEAPENAKAGIDFPVHPDPLVRYQRGGGEFGITAVRNRMNQPLNKLITYSPTGSTSRTMLRFNKADRALNMLKGAGFDQQLPDDPNRQAYFRSERVYKLGPVTLRHILEVVPSKQPVEIGGQKKRLLDTVLVRYIVENNDTKPHMFGMRTQVDTLIGSNDGVPFTIPGFAGLVDSQADFVTPAQKIPAFIQALEYPNLQFPGTVALMTIKVGGTVEPPARLSLTAWPADRGQYEVPVQNMGRDSCVVMYWPEKNLPPKGRREVGFAYGLGAVDAGEGAGKFAITVNGEFDPGKSFTVTGLFTNPIPNQEATLEVQDGLMIEGEAKRKVPPPNAGAAVLTWNVKVERPGEFRVSVSSAGSKQSKLLSIIQKEAPNLGKLTMKLKGDFEPGKTFQVIANAIDPQSDQTLTLKLPEGLEPAPEEKLSQPVAPAVGDTKTSPPLTWTVKVLKLGIFKIRVESSTGTAKTITLTVQGQEEVPGLFTLKLGGTFDVGKTFQVKATVVKPAPQQTLTLELPGKLTSDAKLLEQPVPPPAPDGTSVVTWDVKIAAIGKFPVKVKSSTGTTKTSTLNLEQQVVEYKDNFKLALAGEIAPGKEFRLLAKVTDPAPNQTLTFKVPPQLKLVNGDATQSVPSTKGVHEVQWRVLVVDRGRIPMVVESIGIRKTKTITLTDVEGGKTGGNIFGK